MKPLLLILIKSVKNGIKQLFKKPGALIGYLFMIGLMALSFIGLGSEEEEGIKLTQDIYIAITTTLALLTIIPTLFQSINSLGLNLRSADVNLIFTSPVSPGRILLYSQLRQTGVALYTGIIMLFQAPMLKTFFDFTIEGMAIYVVAWLAILVTPTLFSMFIYIAFRNKQKAKITFKTILYVLLGAYFIWIIYSMLQSENPLNGLISALSADFVKYVPALGWYRHLFASATTGFTFDFFWPLAAILVASVFAGRYAMKTAGIDYYEDAASSAEKIEKIWEASRKGQKVNIYDLRDDKKKKVKKVEFRFSMNGAGAIYQKHLLEYRKKGFFLFNFRTIYMTVLPLMAAYFIPISGEDPDASAVIALGVCVYIAFLIAFQGRWGKELQQPYIYLIPDNPFKKLLFCVAAETLKHLVDGLILFTACAVIFGSSPLVCLLCVIAYVIINALYSFLDIFSQRIFGKLHSKILGTYLKVMLSMLLIVPGIIVVAVMLDAQISAAISMIALNVINLCIAAVIGLLAVGAFKYPEVNQ
ncbi:MAG: putative ABC exporter domain-containing protein [Thermoclostridium sp.]|nr:putative ABC exporter domain-containing protein [Thermoclostridium sp.]